MRLKPDHCFYFRDHFNIWVYDHIRTNCPRRAEDEQSGKKRMNNMEKNDNVRGDAKKCAKTNVHLGKQQKHYFNELIFENKCPYRNEQRCVFFGD